MCSQPGSASRRSRARIETSRHPLFFLLLLVIALQSCGGGVGTSSQTPVCVGTCFTPAPCTACFTAAPSPNLLVADSGNNRVLIFTPITESSPLGGFVTGGQAAEVALGQADFTSSTAATSASGLNQPVAVVEDSTGGIWVSDWANNRVLEFPALSVTGAAATVVLGQSKFTSAAASTASAGLHGPQGLAFDKSGDLWVADSLNNRVLEFVPPFSNGMAASLVLGNAPAGVCDSPPTSLCVPTNVAFDASGDLWVGDTGHNRVLEFAPPFSAGESPTTVLGQPDFSTAAQGAGAAGIYQPWGITFDASGNLWLVDGGNWRVVEFAAPFSSGEAASVVIGYADLTTTTNTNLQTNLTNPRGIAFDSLGHLFVADLGSSRVLEFSPPFSSGMTASNVFGQVSLTSSAPGTTASGLSGPVGLSTSQTVVSVVYGSN